MNAAIARLSRKLQIWSVALLVATACLSQTLRAEVLNFNNLTNNSSYFPIYAGVPYEVGDALLTGPYLQTISTVKNPANKTPAIRLPGSVAGTYILYVVGRDTPFALNSLDVVSISGTLIISDPRSGVYYTNTTAGHISLGSAFSNVSYVDFFIDGEVVIDNINYTLLHHIPVAGIRVLNEMKPSPILEDDVPSHLDYEPSYTYPGYKRYLHYILAPSTNPVPFVVDGSASISPEGEPLAYDWSYFVGGDDGDWYPLLGGVASLSPYFTNQPPYLNRGAFRQTILHVKNAYFEDYVWFGVRVITPEEATTTLWDWLHNRFDRARGPVHRRLIPTLRTAEAQFHNGQTAEALASLKSFQHQARLTFRYAPQLRRALLDFSQQIIDVVSNTNADAPAAQP